jgi:hypothetical protein
MGASPSILTFGKKRHHEHRLLACVGFLLMAALPMLCAHPAMGEGSAPAAGGELSQRGARLQADVTATFEALRQSQALRFAPQGGNDVTPVVLKYIPLGATRDDAVAVLRAAGYQLTPAPDGALYARANLGGGFPYFKPSGLEIVLRSGVDNAHAITQLHAEIFRKPNVSDHK